LMAFIAFNQKLFNLQKFIIMNHTAKMLPQTRCYYELAYIKPVKTVGEYLQKIINLIWIEETCQLNNNPNLIFLENKLKKIHKLRNK